MRTFCPRSLLGALGLALLCVAGCDSSPPAADELQSLSAALDSDADGLGDEEEQRLGTDALSTDSDGDGLSDGDEVRVYGTDPLVADTDGGGLSDGDEIAAGGNPHWAGDDGGQQLCPAGHCDDGNPCTDDECEPADGSCTHTPGSEGASCFGDGVCVAGVCEQPACRPEWCDDGNPCTDDFCDGGALGSCAHAAGNEYGSCWDGGFCVAGACQLPNCHVEDCDDGNPCTIDDCDEIGLDCVHEPAADGATCEGNGACAAGTCLHDEVEPCPLTDRPFGVASDYNMFVLGDLVHTGGDSQGAVAVGGDATLTHFGVGTALPPGGNAAGIGLVVDGDLDQNGGQTTQGDVHVGGAVVNIGGIAGGVLVNPSHPIDFAAAALDLRALSAHWAALAPNGTTTLSAGALVLTGTDPDLNVFHVSAAQWKAAHEVRVDAPEDASIIINVGGVSDDLPADHGWFGAMVRNGAVDPAAWTHTVWNFYEATQLSVANVGWMGSLLAPDADFTYANGNIDGQLIVASLTMTTWSAQVHLPGFSGNLPGSCEPPPPTTPRYSWSEFVGSSAEKVGIPSVYGPDDTRGCSLEVNFTGSDPVPPYQLDPAYEAGIVTLRDGTGDPVEQWHLNRGQTPSGLDADGCDLGGVFPRCWVTPDGAGQIDVSVPALSTSCNAGFDTSGSRVEVGGRATMDLSAPTAPTDNDHETMYYTWYDPDGLDTVRIALRGRIDWALDGLGSDDVFVPLLERGWLPGPDMIAPPVVILTETADTLSVAVNVELATEYVRDVYVSMGIPVE